MVARRFPLNEPALCLDFPSLLLGLSRFDDEEEASGEEASRTGRYCEDRGLRCMTISFAHEELMPTALRVVQIENAQLSRRKALEGGGR